MEAKYYLRLTVVLFLVTAVTAGLLGVLNSVTEKRISQLKAVEAVNEMKAVLPGAASFEAVSYKGTDPTVKKIYLGKSGAQAVGYVVRIESASGDISMLIGVSSLGKVAGVSIISMSDTHGLNVSSNMESVLKQFIGKSGAQIEKANGDAAGSLTNASVYSAKITSCVSSALDAVKTLG